MAIIKDYTGQLIVNKNNIEIKILSLKHKEKNKDSIWDYLCPYCGEETSSTINHIKRGDCCKKCKYEKIANKSKKSDDDFKNELFNKHNNLEIISTYTNYHTKIKVRCLNHDNIFESTPADLLNSEFPCEACLSEHKSEIFKIYDLDYVKNWLSQNDLELVDELEYKNAGTSFTYKCLKCGNIGITNFGNLLSGRKCKGCLGLTKKNTDQFKQEVFDLVGDEYSVLGEYTGNKDNILMRHNTCGHEYYVMPTNFLYRIQRCPKCIESKGEKRISECLNLLNIRYIQEHKFPDCKHISKLRFDFFLPELNILIEYQGAQHYKSVDFMGGEKDFKLRQTRDEIKRCYCNENNYKLIEISYIDYENIEKIIHKALTDVGALVA